VNDALQPSQACYDLIARSEYNGPFPCKAMWDVNGWACGYGTHGPDVTATTVWTRAVAEARRNAYAQVCGNRIKQLVTVPLTQGQFDALVDFEYEFGAYRLHGTTLLAKLNAGDYAGAKQQLPLWIHVEKDGKMVESDGLKARRASEGILWDQK